MFLVFSVLNIKYLAFRTPDASTLLLGLLKFLNFFAIANALKKQYYFVFFFVIVGR